MTIRADDLHALALELKSSKEEVRLRAGASRAFYAAYHWCEAIRFKFSIPRPSNVGSHHALIQALSNFEDAKKTTRSNIRILGRLLTRARRLRVAADYNLDEDFSVNKAEESVLLAGQVKTIAAALL